MTYQCTINLKRAIDWQRGSAEKLNQLLQLKQDWYESNYCDFWNSWVNDVFNLDTANEFGLSVWSIILDVPIFDGVEKSPTNYPAIFYGEFRKNYTRGNFGKNGSPVDSLTIEQKRIMLKLKAFILNSRMTTPSINKKLSELFGVGEVYVLDNLNMTYDYVVNDSNNTFFVNILSEFDLLPRPNSVRVKVNTKSNPTPFKFGSLRPNFGRGNFHLGFK